MHKGLLFMKNCEIHIKWFIHYKIAALPLVYRLQLSFYNYDLGVKGKTRLLLMWLIYRCKMTNLMTKWDTSSTLIEQLAQCNLYKETNIKHYYINLKGVKKVRSTLHHRISNHLKRK